MRKLLILISLFFVSPAFGQDPDELLTRLENILETIEFELETVQDIYFDYSYCNVEGEEMTKEEIAKAKSEVIQEVGSNFVEIAKMVTKESKEIEKAAGKLKKSSPYLSPRQNLLDSLYTASSGFVEKQIDFLEASQKRVVEHINSNFCQDDLEEFDYGFRIESDEFDNLSDKLYYASDFEAEYDEDKITKLMKKFKLVELRADVPTDYYEYVVTVFVSVNESNGKEGLIWANFDGAGQYIPAQFDSITYNSFNEFAFGWNEGKATFFYTPYYGFFADEYSDYEIKSGYTVPYSNIVLTKESSLEHLYIAKLGGMWGVINGILNKPITDFRFSSPDQVNFDDLDREMK